MINNTIVTACNKRYFWGVYLLIASIKYNNGKLPVHVLSAGLNKEDIRLLEQFDNVTIFNSNSNHILHYPHLNKPNAIFTANSEYITWVDADCLFYGNIDNYLTPSNKSFQIRFRAARENESVYKKRYVFNDKKGQIPQHILNVWRSDVCERTKPRYHSQCVTNCISLHQSHLPFIEKWDQQLKSTLMNPEYPVDNNSLAYFMTDESVLASLFTYSYNVPNVCNYQLNQDANRLLIHFGMKNKPWVLWKKSHLAFYRYVMAIITWVRKHNLDLPPLPYSLNERYKIQTYTLAFVNDIYLQTKSKLSNALY